ncbi:MAG: hypothetical protein PUF90_07030 [Lachnospiraceae bacterium]|nr:hypothetical protein [Lachnospiraceae bacterium]
MSRRKRTKPKTQTKTTNNATAKTAETATITADTATTAVEDKVAYPRCRIYEIMQYATNPRTGESFNFGPDNIEAGLKHKTINRYFVVKHDKDPYTQQQYDKYVQQNDGAEPPWKIGELKTPHWHVYIELSTPVALDHVSKWFGVPTQCVEVKRGRDAFIECCQYGTHETAKQQAMGKHMYDDTEVTANFDFRGAIVAMDERKLKYGKKDLTPKEQLRMDVLERGMTLKQAQQQKPLLFAEDLPRLKQLRGRYLLTQTPPANRLNFYIEGSGGQGKDILSRLLARSLYPNLPDDEVYFVVGDNRVPFDGYDGQPVVIWSDRRAVDMLKICDYNVGTLYNILDTHPTASQDFNIKFGSISLVNAVNIINGAQPYEDFLDGISGAYIDRDGVAHTAENKEQIRRRIPLIMCLHENDFSILINRGYATNTREYGQYITYASIVGNFGRIYRELPESQRPQVLDKTSKPIMDAIIKYRPAVEAEEDKKDLSAFANYGREASVVLAEDEAAKSPEQKIKEDIDRRYYRGDRPEDIKTTYQFMCAENPDLLKVALEYIDELEFPFR